MPIYLTDKHNLAGTAVPGATNDRASGYHEGSRWINTLTGTEYVCLDATPGEARWQVNPYAGTQSVAGLNAALGASAETATRMSIKEDFTKRPALASAITALTNSSGGTAAAAIAAAAGVSHLVIPVPADMTALSTGGVDIATGIVPGFKFRLMSWEFITTVAGTGTSASLVANMEIGLTDVGTTPSTCTLTLAGTDTIGKRTAGTAIAGANTGSAADALSVEVAAAGTTFTAGSGYFVVKIQNMDVADALASLLGVQTSALLSNTDFEVFGTNMTSALVTFNAARGGIRLTTAGADNDQAGIQPRQTNSNDSRWATGMVTDKSPHWARSFRLTSVAAISVKQGLAVTNAHNLTTDDDQVVVWFSTATGGNFLVAYSIGGTDATIDTGVTPAAGTEYRLRIEINAARQALVYINDVLVATTPALTTAVNLKPYGSIQALSSAAKSWDLRDKDFASMEQA